MRTSTFASIGRLHIVAIAGLGSLTFGWLMTGQRPWLLAAITCLDWFIVNLLNRAVDLREDLANRVEGSDVVARYRSGVLTAGVTLLVTSMLVGHLLVPAITGLRLSYHLLGAAYNWPILPGRRRLKTIYAWKNIASAMGFMITLFGYPLAQMQAQGAGFAEGFGAAQAAAVALFFFLFELSWEVVYDLRDAPGDAQAGARTFAVVHGQAVAARIADALLLSSALVLVLSGVFLSVPWRALVMVVAPLLQWLLYRRWLARGLTGADVIALTWLGAALLAAYHAWVALGLPWTRSAPWS